MVPTDVRWIFPLVSVFISSISAICLDPRPTRLLLCYQDDVTPQLNPCSCTHLVHQFTDIKSINDQSEFLKSGRKLKEKNPDLRLVASISGSADDLLKNRNVTAQKLAAALDHAQLDGLEFNVNWNNSLVQKQNLVDLIKKLMEEFDGKSSNRVKRNYEIHESQSDDVTTASWKKQVTDSKESNSSQPRVVRESSENEEEYYDENESHSEIPEEEKEETKAEKEEEKSERPFTVFVRLPSRPQTLAKHYDLKQLNKYVDYFVLNTHNISDPAEARLTYHPSRLMGINDVQNADSLVDLLTGLGAAQTKLVISVPSTALQFTLKNQTNNMPQSPVVGQPATLTQIQLCKLMSNGTWMVERDEDLTAPYAYKNGTWLAFDDSTSASIKGKYVLLRELAGVAVMNIEAEDWSNECTQPGPTILSTLYDTLANIGRKTRAAQLYSLQEQLHQASPFSFAADIQSSPYRVARVVDRAGDIHVVRRQIKTEFECSRQGYFTHPSGCNRFYRCVKFNQYVDDYTVFEYDCPAGLAFDERYEVCVWPGSLPDGGACQGSSEIAPVPRNRYVCPAVEGYYADPENCRWFFACLDHARDGVTPLTAYEFRCPFGLVFNEAQLVCDWPWNVQGCGQSGYAGARLTIGDLYEGRLRPSYATFPDYYVSGGRIQGGNAGLVLGSNLVGIPGVGNYDASGSAYSALSAGHDAQYEGGSSNQYSEAIKTGQYAGGVQFYSGGSAQYATGAGTPYVTAGGGQYVASGSSLNAAGKGAQYVAGGGQSSLYTPGNIGGKQSLYSGVNTANYAGGNVGSYASDFVYDNSGAYVHDNSGAYVHDNSGDYVHDDKGYVHDDKGYVHQKDKNVNAGQYVHQYSGGVYSAGALSGGAYNGGAYVYDDSGSYVHDDKGYVHEDKGYIHQKGTYKGEGQYVGIKTGGAYAGGTGYYDSNSGNQYVKVSGVKGQYSGNEANVYINAPLATGQYEASKVGYSVYNTAYQKGTSFVDNSEQYAHDNGGAYVHDESGGYKHDISGSYYHDNGGHYAEQFKQDGENNLQSSGYSGQTVNTVNLYSVGAHPSYVQKGYSAGYIKGVQPASAFINTAQRPVGIVKDNYNYNLPVVTVTTAAPVTISSIHPEIATIANHDIYHPAQPVSAVSSNSYNAVVGSTPVPPTVHFSPIVPVSTPAPPVVHYSPSVSISTPAPPTVYHSLSPVTPSVSPFSKYNSPAISTPVSPAGYHTVSSVSTHVTPYILRNTVSASTPAPPVAYDSPSVSTANPEVYFHGVSTPKTPLIQLPVSTPTPPVVQYSPPPVTTSSPYIYNSAPVVSTGAAYYSTPSPPVVYNKYSHPITTTYIASTPKPVTYYQSPIVTPAPIYKQISVTPPTANVFLSNTAAAYGHAHPTPQPVVFKTPAPINYNPYQTGVTSVTTLPYVSNVTPCSLKEHLRYAEHIHLPIVSITPTVEYNHPPYNVHYYQKQSVGHAVPAVPLAPVQYHQTAVPVTAKPLTYSYKQPIAPVVPVTPAPEAIHYQSVTPSPPPVEIISYKQPSAPVLPVTSAPEAVHYHSIAPPPVPVRVEYKEPVAPVINYQSISTPPPPSPIRFDYKEPVAPAIPITPAPEVVNYQSVTPPPTHIKIEYQQPLAPIVPVTPAPEVVHYQPVTSPPPPVKFEYKQPVTPVVPVTPPPEVVHYQSITPPPAPVRLQYSYRAPVLPIKPVAPVPVVHYQPAPIPLPTPIKIQQSYKQPVVPVTTVTPVTYSVPTSTPIYSYQAPAHPVAPVVTYSVPKKPSYSYKTEAPVTPLKQVFYKEAVTTLAPTYSKPTVISSYSYNKEADNFYYGQEGVYTPKQYYQKPAAFSYAYEKAPVKAASPVSGYYVQQGIYAPTPAPLEYKLKPIVVAPYTPAPTIYSVTTPKCESPSVHVTTTSPVTYYTPTTTAATFSTGAGDYGTYVGKQNYGNSKTASKAQSYIDSKLPDQYLVEVTPQAENQFDSNLDVNHGYKATVNTGSNIYYKSGSYSGSSYKDDKAFENFEADNYQSGFTSSTEKPTIKQVYYTPVTTKIPIITTTEAYVPPLRYSTEQDDKEDELDISNEENDDHHLVSQYDGVFGSKSTEYTTAVSSTANLKEGETVVGVVKDGLSRYTGQKKKKVVVVSRLSDFNPLLVNKLGAECDCTRVVRKRRPRPKSTAQQVLFEPLQTTTVSYEPSYTPGSFESVHSESEAPTVEIRPAIRRRKVHRSTTTTTTESYSNYVENDSDYNSRGNIVSKQRNGVARNKLDNSVKYSEDRDRDYNNNNNNNNNDPINTKEGEDLMNGRVECKRAGLFRHPKYCNKFYSCDWDKWKKKFTLNVMNCPIHLAYDSQLGACNWPSKGPACSDNNLLV